MAIFLPRTNSLILEVPKTGSKWVRMAIERAGVPFRQVGPAKWRGHGTLRIHGRRFSFIACFVRSPIAWYSSYWAYRMEKGWDAKVELDRVAESQKFEEFVRRSTRLLPGVLTAVYETYTGPPEDPIHFIGKQETLTDDLVAALRQCGEEFDEDLLRSTPAINVSVQKPEYPEALKELVMLSEYSVMSRYGYWEHGEDPFGLGEVLSNHPEDELGLRVLAIHTCDLHIDPDATNARRKQPVAFNTRRARIFSNFAVFAQAVKGDIEETHKFYRLALEADGRHPRTLSNYATFLETVLNDIDQAGAYYEMALAIRPDHAMIHGKYGLYLENRKGDLHRALWHYETAVALNPGHAENLGLLASLLMRSGRESERTGRLLEKAVSLAPEDPIIQCNYAYFLAEIANNPLAAERHYCMATALKPVPPLVALNFALFLEDRDRLQEAGEWFHQAVRSSNVPDRVAVEFARFQETYLNSKLILPS